MLNAPIFKLKCTNEQAGCRSIQFDTLIDRCNKISRQNSTYLLDILHMVADSPEFGLSGFGGHPLCASREGVMIMGR
jgi:hypothetical protein